MYYGGRAPQLIHVYRAAFITITFVPMLLMVPLAPPRTSTGTAAHRLAPVVCAGAAGVRVHSAVVHVCSYARDSEETLGGHSGTP